VTAKPAPAAPATGRASEAELLARFPAAPDKVFREVGGADAAWLFAQGAPFLDARRTKAYEEGHVAGARPFPVWESDIDQRVLAVVNEGRRTDLPLVLYCSGGECEDSHMLAERLFAAGFVNLLVYRDGYPDWQKRGGAVRAGSAP
jgi:rhodanese-related sulfurtransferase